MEEFNIIWTSIQSDLKPGTEIQNWTAYRGYLGDLMTISAVNQNRISVDAPRAKTTQIVPREDFEIVWEVWQDYKSQKIKRHEMRDTTFYSKYIISIFHWYETER